MAKCIQCFKMSSVLEAASNIKILIEREESEEFLALFGGGRCVLSQNYKNWYDPILSYWIIPIFVILRFYLPPPNRAHIYLHHYWSPERREQHMNNFRSAAPALGQTFVKPVNAGRKPGHQLRMQAQSEPQGVIFDCINAAPTRSATLTASVANISPCHLFQSLHHQKLQLSA